MQKTFKYRNTFYKVDVIKKAIDKLIKEKGSRNSFKVAKGDMSLKFDDEREFFADYKKNPDSATIGIEDKLTKASINIEYIKNQHTSVSVNSASRGDWEDVFEIFDEKREESIEKSTLSERSPVIFIGHGGSSQWKELKEHLTDKHGYTIMSYETGSRSGHTIRDILEDMSNKSSIAFLVMTGENKREDGTITARPNVIHEVGLFQGKLGFSKAIVLLEEDTEEFSNLYGIQQIRFSKGNIRETFGDVLALIKREIEL
jgi:predicted nucleotide-binding protein